MIDPPLAGPDTLAGRYDLVVVGSGFGSLFFLEEWLRHAGGNARAVVLERGGYRSHAEQIARGANGDAPASAYVRVPEGHKPWNFTIGLGGGTLCWWGQTPRMHPNDFRLRTLYGVGADWPIDYDALEPYYAECEWLIGVAGDGDRVGPFRRSRPYPMPAHLPSDADRAMRALYPGQLALPSARTSVPDGARPQCCGAGECRLCPSDAKFTALNGLAHVLADPRVSVVANAEAVALDMLGGRADGVVFRAGDRTRVARGETVVLGANAIFNAAILKRSGLDHPRLGRGINEQVGYHLEVRFARLNGVNGSTAATGMFCDWLDGEHRREVGASCLVFNSRWKFYGLRPEYDKLFRKCEIIVNAEDMPSLDNFVEVPDDWNETPVVHHARHSEYGERGAARAIERLDRLLAPLDVEGVSPPERRGTESHLQGTVPMARDAADGIVDDRLLHHRVRNLAVVGTSAFPTCPVANPSLTAAALSKRAARLMAGNAAAGG